MRSRDTLLDRFSFDSVSFQRVAAHGGCEPILFCRVREGTASTAFNFVDLAIVPPGAEIGRHTHRLDNEETYFVMSHHRQGEYAVRRVWNAFGFDEYADLLAHGEALLVVSPTVSRVYSGEVEELVAASRGVIARTICVSGEPAKQMAAVEHVCQ